MKTQKIIKITGLVFGLILANVLTASSALAFKLGENQTFFVDSAYDLLGRTQVPATLRQVGDHALFYAADDWWSSLGQAEQEMANAAILNLVSEFDSVIYPRLTGVYGSEWSPGIDNDLRITIFITKIKNGTGGYFNSVDEYPRAQIAGSNEREMIYLNSSYLDSSSAKIFLAHEFQHMINFYQKEKLRNALEEVWLNEARSEYSATLCGYDNIYEGSNLERRVRDFLRNSTDSLTEWQNESADYAAVNLFMQYLVSRYGEQILTSTIKTEAVGIASINQFLATAGFSERFDDIFSNWVIANYINDCQLGDGQKYCYLNSRLPYARFHVAPQMSNLMLVRDGVKFSFADSIKDWSGRWYELLPVGSGLNLMVNFQEVDAANFRVALLLFNFDGSRELYFLNLESAKKASAIISGFGNKVAGVVMALFSNTNQTGFSANEPTRQFSYDAQITAASQLPTSSPTPTPIPGASPPIVVPATNNPGLPDGALIRAKGDSKVYIIKGQYRRWLQTPQILFAYPHLGWQSVIEVSLEQLNWYQEAWLVRADGDARVYEINGDGTKHWLNISADMFTQSGRSWEAVYVINKAERDLYRTGADVMR